MGRPRSAALEIRIGDDGGRSALMVDGVVQSISPEDGLADGGYWAAMVPDEKPRRALILGMGGGTLAQLLRARWGKDVYVVGVDDNETILDLAQSMGWLPATGCEVVIADAFAYVQTCADKFDYVAIDLFRGEEQSARTFGKPFLRRVRVLLEARGRLAVNLFTDIRVLNRIARVATFFEIRDKLPVGGNLVIHARKRR